MRQNWTCSRCFQKFSRKWNLERHFKLVHGQNEQLNNFEIRSDNNMYGNPRYDYNQRKHSSRSVTDYFGDLIDFSETLNKMSNSSQTFGKINSLQLQVSALQQQLTNVHGQLNGVVSSNWLMPRESVQGFSGYVCTKCQTFSLKPVFDIGYDKTMQSRHCCIESAAKRNYINFDLPSNVQSTDEWAAQILFSHIDHRLPLKFLYSKDLTRGLSNYVEMIGANVVHMLGNEVVRDTFFGIPDRYYSYSIQNYHDITWVDQTINNMGKRIHITNEEARDFLRKVMSTYAIFEIPIGNVIKQVYIGFTDL